MFSWTTNLKLCKFSKNEVELDPMVVKGFFWLGVVFSCSHADWASSARLVWSFLRRSDVRSPILPNTGSLLLEDLDHTSCPLSGRTSKRELPAKPLLSFLSSPRFLFSLNLLMKCARSFPKESGLLKLAGERMASLRGLDLESSSIVWGVQRLFWG